MEFNQTEWFGTWVNFERCIYSEEPAMKLCWAEAEEAQLPMLKHGAKSFWKMACSTVNEENNVRLDRCRIEAAGVGLRITWFGEQNKTLGSAVYRLSAVMLKGLESVQNFLFEAQSAPEDWPFRYLLATEPRPKDPKKSGILRYLHFQYASQVEMILHDTKLQKPMWYATMCTADGSLLDWCNLVRVLHRLPTWNSLPQNRAPQKSRMNHAQTVLANGVCQYLQEHLHGRITIEELAKQFGVSPTQLKTSFRGVYGTSVQTYHRELKIHAAAKLLRSTNRTVLDIASEFGYANGSKFAAAFQRVMGVTPNEYRMK